MVNKYNISIKLQAKILQNDLWVRKKKITIKQRRKSKRRWSLFVRRQGFPGKDKGLFVRWQGFPGIWNCFFNEKMVDSVYNSWTTAAFGPW
jgi:hypothetical protein